jgi:hypothetical protein
MASPAFRIGRVFWFLFNSLSHKLLILLGVSMEKSAKPIGTANKPRPGGKKSKRDPINAILGKRPSSKQLRETLTKALPVVKAKRRTGKSISLHKGYNESIGAQVLALMAEGYTLTETCDRLMISRSTAYKWMEESPAFRALYARARVALAEHSFSQALAIPKDLYAKAQSGEPLDGPTVAAARLLTDSLKWYAERLNPASYAAQSKQSVEISGTMAVASVVVDSRSLSPDARDALRYALQAANAAPTIEHDDDEGEGG